MDNRYSALPMNEYRKKADETIRRIIAIMMAAQKKADSLEYKKRAEMMKKNG